MILTSGTTGTPKGAARKQPDSLEPAAALFSKIPLKARETTVIAAPMFHSWGFAHFTLALPLASTLVLRRRFDPEETLRAVAAAPRQRARGRAGDAAADPRARRGDDRALRPAAALRVIARQRLGAARRAGDARDGRVRRRALQPVRLDRGRLGDDRHARGPARGARAPPGSPPMGTVVKLLDEQGREVARGAGRAHLRRQRDGLRGLHRRRRQGGRRRADEHRRRRPFRRGRPPVRRRARRRDDRLAAARTCSRARSRTCSPTTRASKRPPSSASPDERVRPALKAFVVPRDGAELERGDGQGVRQAEPRPLQGPARRGLPGGAAAQRDRQGAQARAVERRDVRIPPGRSRLVHARPRPSER